MRGATAHLKSGDTARIPTCGGDGHDVAHPENEEIAYRGIVTNAPPCERKSPGGGTLLSCM